MTKLDIFGLKRDDLRKFSSDWNEIFGQNKRISGVLYDAKKEEYIIFAETDIKGDLT